ncbi:ArsR/SmtB family transcription factor [Actinomadura rubrisoli]|uniref:Transcriptional regulator n=1 Tax=Actinomadura rubrisoli TaxID=2530368 RepID=A0A4R5C9Z0_9ACTN|nr:helix-turn-helix domain-containing protein [Actinomadura rubrisoli]TDD96698.1 transcriptional regulator [Actinomadura rubrisoli]
MGWWQINTDTLAGSRFVVSPLAETIATLKALERGTAAHPSERAWLDVHLPAYRERLSGDPITALLVRAALGPTWNADFLTPTPAHEGEGTFADEVALVRGAPPGRARDDLVLSLGGPVPAELHRSDLPERAADLLEWIWTRLVLPSWPRRRRIIEADIVARTAQLSRGGWAGALDDLRPGMRWLGGSRLQVNTHDNPPRDLGKAQLMFVPVTPRHGWASWTDDWSRFAVVYPCSGALAETGTPAPEALGRLLGPARAGVLVQLGSPKSTTQLVALTGQGLGSVGRHLRILLDARLVQRRRAGRSVLYYRTTAGDVLVGAQQDGDRAT